MTPEERNRIIDNDYFDLIIDYNADPSLLNMFKNASINIINIRYAIVHISYEDVNNYLGLAVGYSTLPHCYSLTSTVSLETSGVLKVRSTPGLNLQGSGTLIGIIDTGIDYTNPIFKNNDGTTRIVSIWDQSIVTEKYPENFYYGTEYTRGEINFALHTLDPYSVVPSKDEIGHGTMLAGVAGGKIDISNQFSGVAPEAEFVIVKLKDAKQNVKDFYKIPEDAICYQENDIMLAAKYLYRRAIELKKPIVICIGLGSSQGAHDGSDPIEDYLTSLGTNNGVAITVSAGNEGSARRHFFGTINKMVGYIDVELNIAEGESGFTMELWGNTPGIYSINILSPSGEFIPRIPARIFENRTISFIMEETRIIILNALIESLSGDQLIGIQFQNPSPGIWRFQVFNSGDMNVGFNVWLPMGDFISGDTYFIRSSPETTILSPGNGFVPITITAYDPIANSLYRDASRGYTRTGETVIVPTIAAPGVNITVPTLEQGFSTGTGTGVATAHAAGVAALLLEWGIVRGNYSRLDSVGIKKLMIKGARRNPNIKYPNRDWGYGMIDAYNIFTVLRRDLS
ncbi:MAG TPA: S8 family peptidase [Clostridiales bacterium]|nr:S8 family peptidase [Clostridiales bacterium]